MDIENAVSDIAGSMGLGKEESQQEELDLAPETTPETAAEAAPDAQAATGGSPETVVLEVPKSWPKEMHEHWGKTPAEVQKFWATREQQMVDGLNQYKEGHSFARAMAEVTSPYMPMIEASGLDAPKAVSYLLAAHARLTQGSPESRRAAYEQLGRDLGFAQDNTPPEIRAERERLDRIESMLTREQQARLADARQRAAGELEAFAKDHPHLDEVADDLIVYLNAGMDLAKAYERAVYANPVVRQKELARLTEEARVEALKKAKEEAEAARKATAANVKGRNTQKSPTEAKGKFLSDESMLEDLRSIQERAH